MFGVKRKILSCFFIIFGIIFILTMFIVLKKFNPESVKIFPPCIFHTLTGLYCPGCGMTRATHALLNFEFKKALDFNPLFFVLLPLLIYMGIMQAISLKYNKKLRVIKFSYPLIIMLFVVVVLFFILRNIPAEPFIYLAP